MRLVYCVLLALTFTAGALTLGCTKAPAPSSAAGATGVASKGAGPSPAPSAEDGAKGDVPSGEGMTIAVVPKGMEHIFWQTVRAGAEAAAKATGAKMELRGPDSETDVVGRVDLIDNYITRKVDGLVVAACDADALIEPLQRAKDAGILVATMDSGINDDTVPITYAATDNVLGGRKAAEARVEAIGGKGKVAVIPFIQGARSSDERERGFKEAIAEHPEVELVATLYSDSQVEKGVQVTENLLNSQPDLVGIFSANEAGTKGAMRVLEQRGLAGKVKLVGYDAAPDQIEALRAGTIQALIVQNPFAMGYEGLMAVVKAKAGQDVEPRIDTGVTVVTMENIEEPDVAKLLAGMVK